MCTCHQDAIQAAASQQADDRPRPDLQVRMLEVNRHGLYVFRLLNFTQCFQGGRLHTGIVFCLEHAPHGSCRLGGFQTLEPFQHVQSNHRVAMLQKADEVSVHFCLRLLQKIQSVKDLTCERALQVRFNHIHQVRLVQ